MSIRRGRDHGLQGYTAYRRRLGLAPLANFTELTNDIALAASLQQLYGSIDQCDLFVCGLIEAAADSHPNALRQNTSVLGPTFKALFEYQFSHTRDGDRFWYANRRNDWFSENEQQHLDSLMLKDVILANANLDEAELADFETVMLRATSSLKNGSCSTAEAREILEALPPCPDDPCQLESMKDSQQCSPADLIGQRRTVVGFLLGAWALIIAFVIIAAFWGFYKRQNYPTPSDDSLYDSFKSFCFRIAPQWLTKLQQLQTRARHFFATNKARNHIRKMEDERLQELLVVTGFSETVLLDAISIWNEITKQ